MPRGRKGRAGHRMGLLRTALARLALVRLHLLLLGCTAMANVRSFDADAGKSQTVGSHSPPLL
ncbi:exported hypothetical protein [uncultured delta proteobacterium]|uniref:Uncharacterized protein n=1 Tax=uncultured delta proteobacterium TaxID=34034 RepID=A0A212KF35_9DELT|nr:exported hypothetical protein [uncultured delta proteobacterium]